MTNADSIIAPAGAITAEVELTILASRQVVWNAFVNETNAWWHKDF